MNNNNPPNNVLIVWLIIALAIGAIPHLVYQPLWVTGLFVLMMGWRLMHHWRQWPLPADKPVLKWLHSLGAVFTIVLLVADYGMTIGRDAGVALLTIMLAFKVVEINNRRDFYLACFLGYFFVTTNFFYTQNMLILLLMVLVVVLLTASLIHINSPTLPHKTRLKLAGSILLQALPVMVVLFILFPRIPGPIWGLPEDANAGSEQLPDGMTLGDSSINRGRGSTGMSDELLMGRISDVIQSDAIAFRVEFENDEYPPNNERYWRGPVLWTTDGSSWQPLSQYRIDRSSANIAVAGQAYQYTMTLEAHNRNWLFALDMPVSQQSDMRTKLSADGLLTSENKLRSRSQITMTSHTAYRFNAEEEPLLDAALQLPKNQHPRTKQLANELRDASADDADYVQSVLSYFREQPFYYTLQPPLLSGDVVDQFLFESREGFCEHYAASFTVLMRAAGIPARIVTGYQGGEINPVDNVMVIRQREAHAWSEVWLPEQGWLRVDPTAAVSPNRVEMGIADLLPSSRNAPAILGGNTSLLDLWRDVKNNWEALNNAWDMWVVGYGPALQKAVLSLFGMQQPNWQKMALWLAIAIAILFSLIALLMLWQKPIADPVQRSYQQFCRKLAKQGVVRERHEGPSDFAQRAVKQLPTQEHEILKISEYYRRLRYADDTALKTTFVDAVKHFSAKR
ncbi:transglutaminase TgpA family protein [Methylophaga sp. OBS3]|uniref:transglutaminase TgpA family protein n=1 Tax=Methylophaga sp. OBS3 TaxID=2991934 RepID=UPI0022517D4C|nr:DUF3488 and transglutaminase-like domain-containing protein [Methylophaga sp. OBS3]MCX4190161.1 DUF3488 and transglutaminase-like domain-containing protein [Methylophaga sp. OBS3]